VQKLRSQIAEYLDRIDPENITPDIWGRTVHWFRWHGDGKSSTGGVFHVESMLTTEMDYNVTYWRRWFSGSPPLCLDTSGEILTSEHTRGIGCAEDGAMMAREGGAETYPAMRSSCSWFTGGVGNKDRLTLLSPTMAFAASSLIPG